MNIEDFAGRLKDAKFKKRSIGPLYSAHCPAHQDASASFAVWEGQDGWLHVRCKAGCTEDAILGAMRLTQDDRRTASAIPIEQNSNEIEYPWHHTDGTLLFKKVRKGHGKGKKFFLQWLDPDSGQWKTNVLEQYGDAVRDSLYRVTEVLAAVKTGKRIWVVGGEKSAEAFRGMKETATCQPFGEDVNNWRDAHTNLLAGAEEVIVVSDCDDAGEAYANTVALSLIGKVKKVRVVQSKTQGEKDDAFDHFAKDYGLDEFIERPDLLYGKALELETFDPDTFEEVEMEFLWEPYLPKGKMILLDADGGLGKTTFILASLACLSRGVLPNNEGTADRPYRILYLHRGEDTSEEIATVFKRCGGDLKNLFLYSAHDILFNPAGIGRLHSTIIAGKYDIVVTDAFFYFIAPLVKSVNALEGLIPILEGLQAVCRNTQAVMINVRHTRKGQLGEEASDKGLGSVQFRNSHRGQLVMRAHPDKLDFKGVVVVEDTKGSLLVKRGELIGFKRDGGGVTWVELDENPFSGATTESGLKSDSAKNWLQTYVRQQQPVAKAAVVTAGASQGFTQRTLERAAKELGIVMDFRARTWSFPS